jgi:asparagine synthase (glutamine-hydrolysing)
MFAFALWDSRARRLTLARDRFGKKPLFWAATPGGGLAFASELPALREIAGRNHAIDEIAVHHFLSLGMIPGPRTIFRGLSALPVASRLDVDSGRGVPEVRSWAPPPEPLRPIVASGESLLDAIDDKLTEAVRLRLRSDVPVGVMLSGGIDSGLVAAYATRAGARDLHAFVVRAADRRYDETELAHRTAERLELPLDEVDLGIVDEAVVRAAVGAHGQPFGDPSAVPSWLLAREISRHRKCVLVGDGGDEIFAGYRRYTLARWLAHLPSVDLSRLSLTGHHGRSRVGFARRAARISGVRGPDAYQLLTTDLMTPALMRHAFPQLVAVEADEELRRLLPVDPFADGGKGLMRADRDLLLAWDLLPKMDIATMSHGVEARAPFLDSELAAFASAIPASRLVGRFTTKPVLRALARRHLPPEVVKAPKRGFEVPLDRWLAGPLRPLLEDTLLAPDAHIRQFAEPSTIIGLVTGDDELVGARPHLVWALLVLELFLRES